MSKIECLQPLFQSLCTFHQVVDIHLGDQGEVIANIPIRVSAKAVFAQYTICPLDDINFGSMVINNRKQTCFTIHNKGPWTVNTPSNLNPWNVAISTNP